MAGAIGLKRRKSSTKSAVHWGSLVYTGVASFFHWAWVLAPLIILAIPVLAFFISPTVREWALGALGYGLIPVALWVACFTLALRYRYTWIKRLWRVWIGSALLVMVSLGVMSMLHTSGGIMKDASLGGHWGQYFGGSPLALGAVKVAVMFLLGPLLLFPPRAATIYKRVSVRAFQVCAIALSWLAPRLALLTRGLATRSFSAGSKRGWGVGFLRRLRIFGRANSGSTATEPPPRPPQTEKPSGWQLPSMELLNKGESRPVSQTVLQEMAEHIETTLADHKVDVAVQDIRTGPRVIRFGLVPGWVKKYREGKGTKPKATDPSSADMSRVKVQSILVREKDLALALRTPYLRLEAPVPGEALVGLEVPNPHPCKVALRSVAETPDFQKIASKGKLPVAIGEDTGGEPVVADLSGLPHLLIAGATGSGKSVCINTIVASLLLTKRPDELRMLMVDPKRVELTPFNGIPHLIAPVIVDADEVLAVLRAVQNEMIRRYKLMEGVGARNVEGYNKKAKEEMPFLLIIIDELADLMMAAAYEVEQSLVRLAQLGRATGIHLILATQRPSVNVVTGLLKANIPARIAFAVASQVDSRVILDTVGAEKLLGKGDTLLLTSDSPKARRVQGTFMDDREIEKLVEFWKGQSGPPLPVIPLDGQEDADNSRNGDAQDEDDILDKARALAERHQQLSASVLQRRLQIGYSRAVQLMEILEDEGSISRSGAPAGKSRKGAAPF